MAFGHKTILIRSRFNPISRKSFAKRLTKKHLKFSGSIWELSEDKNKETFHISWNHCQVYQNPPNLRANITSYSKLRNPHRGGSSFGKLIEFLEIGISFFSCLINIVLTSSFNIEAPFYNKIAPTTEELRLVDEGRYLGKIRNNEPY